MSRIYLLPSSTSTASLTIQPEPSAVPLSNARVFIVMATYNGERFIEAQIASLQHQTYRDWVLLVRDDGSCDQTCERIARMATLDVRIRLLTDDLGNKGTIGNFSILMEAALKEGADYLFFADQDDVWQANKLTIMLTAMQEMERQAADKPLLVHCDLEVVDEVLQSIAPSFTKFSRLSPTRANLGMLLCQNQVTGCASLINRNLLELACPVPHEVLMHDWWLALLAAASGKIGFVPLPLVRYRQHGRNVLGAVSFGKRLWQLLSSSSQWKRHIAVIKGGILQSSLLAERLNERNMTLPQGALEQINTYAHILDVKPIHRAATLSRYGIGKSLPRTGLIYSLFLALIRIRHERKCRG